MEGEKYELEELIWSYRELQAILLKLISNFKDSSKILRYPIKYKYVF